jgi:hypothetical protein
MKSRFCHKCGKKYTDDWSDKKQEMVFDVPHRHMVFTRIKTDILSRSKEVKRISTTGRRGFSVSL